MSDMLEKELQAAVLNLARLHGWRCYHTFDSRRSAAGFPDLVLARPPRLILAELKTAKGRLSDAQGEWLSLLRACPGVEVYVWRPGDLQVVQGVLARRETEAA